ncbi:hypothetical protein RE428_45880 [Marinobacter nanhaiticus D15-8W]|uniref:LysE family translocator n=1 Tax=Marinobacter nanhaiticus D15-8W TaxID=626887 RepID=N6VZ67_9GAMM|nr:hypothetical protein [Marinobacter nanhaiticus]ENO15580.1 hypothetical protein J057_09516 [Marinobacter nanhaiticus D15-8W]BES73570.1 hypothetical protein RE428_45880 [Marinobacter nanhaiticus D15-8W]
MFLRGVLFIAVAAVVGPLIVLVGARLIGGLHKSRLLALWMDRGLGALFITLGVRLAMSERG